jgi:hypothetical protein
MRSIGGPIPVVLEALLVSLTVALPVVAQQHAPLCEIPAAMARCPTSPHGEGAKWQPLPAGDAAPAFLLAAVQPFQAPEAWREVYREVERCVGLVGGYDAIRWGVMEGPLRGPSGSTYAFTVNSRIVLIRGDTTYLRHEMLHHILEVAGWHPRTLRPGERYTIADLHPMPLFGLCTGGR